MKKIGELPGNHRRPGRELADCKHGKRHKKITYEICCQAVKATLGIPTVVQSIDSQNRENP